MEAQVRHAPVATFRVAGEETDRRYQHFYTAEAAGYDRIRFANAHGSAFNQNEQATILRLLNLQPGARLLDVAAGTGRIAAYLAEQGLQVVACDLTPNMLRQAQARAQGLPNVMPVNGNARRLPFPDNQFDAVISIRFLHLFPASSYRQFIDEMWRVLRPGGVLLVQFDSALAGGGAVWGREMYRRVVRGHKPRYLFGPIHVSPSFAIKAQPTLHGFSPFGERHVRRVSPRGAAWLSDKLAEGQLSFLANHVFVRAVKER